MAKSALYTDNESEPLMTFYMRATVSAAAPEGIVINFTAAHAPSLVL